MVEPATEPQSITLLLRQIEQNRVGATSPQDQNEAVETELYERVKVLFRRIAMKLLSNYPQHATSPATQIIDDVFLKLLNQPKTRYADRRHFIRIAAKATRGMIVDHLRALDTDRRHDRFNR